MSRNILISSLLLLCLFKGRAQETFFTFLGDASTGYHIAILEDNYVVAGFGAISFGNDGLFFHEVSLEGEYLSSNHFHVDTVTETEIRIKGYESSSVRGVHAVGQLVYQDSLQAFYFRFKEDFSDTLYTLAPFDIGTYSTSFSQVVELGPDSLLITGTYQTTLFQSEILLLCIDTLGNTIWQNNIAVQGQNIFPVDILPTEDGRFILTALEFIGLGDSTFDDEIHSRVYVLNEVGDVLAQRKPGNHQEYWTEPGGTILRDDGGFITFWADSYIIIPTVDQLNEQATIWYAIYDQNGTLVDEGNYLDFLPTTSDFMNIGFQYDMRDIIKLEDGNILISGDNYREAFLMKVSQDGEYIWHRTYSPIEDIENDLGYAETTINTSIPLPDGGFLCPGEFFSFNSPDFPNGKVAALLLKLDEYGCLEPGCQLVGIEEYELRSLQVWPNPAGTSATLSVRLPSGVQAERVSLVDMKGSSIDLKFEDLRFDSHGQGTLQYQISDLTSSPGLYTLIITTRDGKVFSEKVVLE